jgi:hypothetical protein
MRSTGRVGEGIRDACPFGAMHMALARTAGVERYRALIVLSSSLVSIHFFPHRAMTDSFVGMTHSAPAILRSRDFSRVVCFWFIEP